MSQIRSAAMPTSFPCALRRTAALQSNRSTEDQHMPSESSLECGEHLWPHGLEPRLQFILIVDVLFDDIWENMLLCCRDHIEQALIEVVDHFDRVARCNGAAALCFRLVEAGFDHDVLP